MKINREYMWPASIALTLVLIKALLWYAVPLPVIDASWSLSHSFSIIRGQLLSSSFGHDYLTLFQFPYGYGLVASVWFLVFEVSNLSFIAYHAALLVLQVILMVWLLAGSRHDSLARLLILVAWFTSGYAYGMRYESLGIIVLLVIMLLMKTESVQKGENIFWVGLAIFAASMVHPVCGVVSVMYVFGQMANRRATSRHYLRQLGVVVMLLVVGYGPVVMLDFDSWWHFMFNIGVGADGHTPNYQHLLKFFMFSPLILILGSWSAVSSVMRRRIGDLGLLIASIIVIGAFGRSYYYAYLMPLVVFQLREVVTPIIPRGIVVSLVLVAPAITHYMPAMVLLEHPVYGTAARNVATTAELFADTSHTNGRLFLDAYVALSAIDQDSSRLIIPFYRHLNPQPRYANENDRFLHAIWSERDAILKNYVAPDHELVTIEIVSPVRGHLIYPYYDADKRSDSLGLWLSKAVRRAVE